MLEVKLTTLCTNFLFLLILITMTLFLQRSLPGVQETFMTYTVYDDMLTLNLVQEACLLLGKRPIPLSLGKSSLLLPAKQFSLL